MPSVSIGSLQACGASNSPCSDVTAGRAKYKQDQLIIPGLTLIDEAEYSFNFIDWG